MPKIKQSITNHMESLVKEFGKNIFSTDGKILYCKICNIKVTAEKRFTIQQHIERDKHKRGLIRVDQRKQSLLLSVTEKDSISKFSMDLCESLISANIPLGKLTNNKFRNFLETYTNQSIPSESTLRKSYVNLCYDKTMDHIRNEVSGKKIWVSIDETTDVDGRHVVNIIIGTMTITPGNKVFLLSSDCLEKVNYLTICKFFDTSLLLLWENGVDRDNILLFVTDAAPYMIKAATALRCLYTKMIHVTCAVHGLHRVCSEVRKLFPDVDDLLSNIKKIFSKCPSRIVEFKKCAPNIPLPPRPSITRWGSWLEAAIYCSKNFESLKEIICKFDSEESVAVKKAQECLLSINVGDLVYIEANLEPIISVITKLQAQGLSLVESNNIILDLENLLRQLPGDVGCAILKKFENVFLKNNGFQLLKKVSKILSGKIPLQLNEDIDISLNDIKYFKYAPIQSVDVERTFSMYNNILTDNRRSFLFENLKMMLIVQCNANLME